MGASHAMIHMKEPPPVPLGAVGSLSSSFLGIDKSSSAPSTEGPTKKLIKSLKVSIDCEDGRECEG